MSAATLRAAEVDRLDLLLRTPKDTESDLSTTFQALHERRYTGAITLHFRDGVPRVLELPAPQIKLR